MPPFADRRAHVRMEAVGTLWGTLELKESARVIDISTTGALIESPVPAAIQSTQPIVLMIEGEEITVQTQVRRLGRSAPQDAQVPRYLIGVEFVSPAIPLLHAIEQMWPPPST